MIELLAGLTLGLHLGSIHIPDADHLQGLNPGVYVRTEGGLTAGVYHNSLSKPTVYVGQTIATGLVDVSFVLATGYRRHRVPAPDCSYAQGCDQWSTPSKAAITPLITLSKAFPMGQGVMGRVTVLPYFGRAGCSADAPGTRSSSGSTAIHFSIEKDF